MSEGWVDEGFESFEAFNEDQKQKLDKLKRQVEEKQKMIDRHAEEKGQLRKENREMEEKLGELEKLQERLAKLEQERTIPKGGTEPEKAPPQQADPLADLTADQLEKQFSDSEAEELTKFYETLDDEHRNLIDTSEEARAETMREFLRSRTRQDGIFRSRNRRIAAEKSVTQQIRELFAEANNRNRAPKSVEARGVPPRQRIVEEQRNSAIKPIEARSGSLLDSLK